MKIKEKVHESIFSFSPASLQDIEREINNLNPQKASTSGNIPTRSLKDNIDMIRNILHKMFNDAVLNSEFPDKLKFADIYIYIYIYFFYAFFCPGTMTTHAESILIQIYSVDWTDVYDTHSSEHRTEPISH